MHRSFAALALLLSTPALGQSADPWFGRDKALHFGLSAGLAGAGYVGGALVFEEDWAPLASGAGLALSLGIAKELWDLSGRGTASFRDLAWDAAGTATGLLTAWAIDRLLVRLGVKDEVAASPPAAAWGRADRLGPGFGPFAPGGAWTGGPRRKPASEQRPTGR